MNISKKLKITGVALLLAAFAGVAPTIAWLSDSTETVVNYFDGGAIALTLDESAVDTHGNIISGADRVAENHYTYVAGATLSKDPTVTVLADSEDCYVYVLVDNTLPEDLFTLNIDTENWEAVGTVDGATIYRYKQVVSSSSEDTVLPAIFTTVTVSENLTAADVSSLGTKTVKVTAWAVQAAELSQEDADALAKSYFEGVDVASIESSSTTDSSSTKEAGSSADTQSSDTEAAALDAVDADEVDSADTEDLDGESED